MKKKKAVQKNKNGGEKTVEFRRFAEKGHVYFSCENLSELRLVHFVELITYLVTDITSGVSGDLGELTWPLLLAINVRSFPFH